MASFEDLMRQFLSPDNEIRGKAEAAIQELTSYPEMLCEQLIGVLKGSQDEQVRAVTAVIVRKTVTKDYWPKVPPAAQSKLKIEILQAVEQEQVGNIRKKIADTVGELASYMEDGAWPELLPFLFRNTKSSSPGHRESALHIFGQLASSLDATMLANLPVLHNLLSTSLQDPESIQVRIAALRATAAVLPGLESKMRAQFNDTLPLMLAVLSACLQAGDEDDARLALEELIDIADSVPQFFKPQMAAILEACYTVASSRQLDAATRHLAVECLVTLTEKAAGMVRKMPAFTQHLFPLALNMMLETEDDPAWYSGGQGDEEDNEYTSYDVGEEALDRISIALGGKTLLPIAFDAHSPNAVPAFLASPDWRNRHAGLMAISQIGEGCQKQMHEQLPAVVGMLLKHFQDPHPRARWAAINAVGQLCTDFGPELQNKLHASVLPALVAVMEDSVQRVQSHGAAAVINFTENCDKQILQGYLHGLLGKLLALLQNSSRMVQEQAITAIASVADCAEDLFLPYYSTCMPLLKQILVMASGTEHRMLRGKAMECISLIAIAVGRDVFAPDAKEVMDRMMQLQTAAMDPDDPQIGYLLQAWGRIAKCLGEAFQPYLAVVMPPLLKSAELEPDINITDADEEIDEDEDQDNVETITLNNKRISIKTSVLEEKATACNMICCYVTELTDGFFPYVDPVAKIMVPLMKFIYHDEVRSAAVSCTPELIKCAVSACRKNPPQCDQNYVKQLLDYVINELLTAITTEPDIDVLVAMTNAMHECINAVGENCLNAEQMAGAVEAVRVVVVESNERRQERDDRKDDEDYDEEEGDLILEENCKEEELLDEAASCVGALVKCSPGLFVESAQPLLSLFGGMLERSEPSDRRIGLCVFDDIFEHAGGLSAALLPQIAPYYFKHCLDADADCRQAAVYGLGVCAQHCQAQFAPLALEAAQKLTAIITHPEARSEVNMMATDNAISALGKLCEYQAGNPAVQTAELCKLWLSHLPLRADDVEARVVHSQLTSLCERNIEWVFGEGHSNLPKIVAVLCEAMNTSTADDATSARIRVLLGQLRSSLQGEMLNMVFGSLSPELQSKLQ